MQVYEDLDELDKSNLVAFTWTPNPAKYPSDEPWKQYECCISHIANLIEKCFSYYMFVPEINRSGNVHIHGYFKIKDKIKFYKMFVPRCKTFGYIDLKFEFREKPIDSKWVYYCLDEIEETAQIVSESKLPPILTHENIDNYVEVKQNIRLIKKPLYKRTNAYWRNLK